MDGDWYSQRGYRCRLEWGYRGAREAAGRGDILVVVDTLRFSSAVATAIHHGVLIYPCAWADDAEAIAHRVGGEAAIKPREGIAPARFSLSPLSYWGAEPGTRVVLPSPNGATCSRYGADVPFLFVGTLLNARAVAAAVSQQLEGTDLCATFLACGERWRTASEDGELRIAMEDYLGAGAILAHVDHDKSPEALACEGAFRHLRHELESVLLECGSGRELREKGCTDDVRHAARLNLYDSVPILRGEWIERRA
jgi:2-phosphosulfolactate phosphatase